MFDAIGSATDAPPQEKVGANGFEFMPAIDLRHGRVVRLQQGDDARQTVYGDDPEKVLRGYADSGIQRVHIVDLDAAFGEAPQRELIERLLSMDSGPSIQLGGGLRDRSSVDWAFAAGAERVVITSLMVRDFAAFAELCSRYSQRVVAALDCRDGDSGAQLRLAGWTESASEDVETICERLRRLPLAAVLVTDIGRDGMMSGPNIALAARLGLWSGAPSIVSGGVQSLVDLELAVAEPGVGGVVVGKALFDGSISLDAAMRTVEGGGANRGVRARPITGLTHRVIPCLDVQDGRVVKGVNFQNLVDHGDPAEAAKRYAEQGADEIVFLDIGAGPERRDTDLDWVSRVAEQVFVPLCVGGGVRKVEDARELLLAGADKIGINSAAVDRPELLRELAERFGKQCVVLSVDARRRPATGSGTPTWEVMSGGGRHETGLDALEWIFRATELGAGEILLTSIDSDGTQDGYDTELLRAVCSMVSEPVIASGGAGTIAHLEAALSTGVSAVLAASIFHEGTFTVSDVKQQLSHRFPMRTARHPR